LNHSTALGFDLSDVGAALPDPGVLERVLGVLVRGGVVRAKFGPIELDILPPTKDPTWEDVDNERASRPTRRINDPSEVSFKKPNFGSDRE